MARGAKEKLRRSLICVALAVLGSTVAGNVAAFDEASPNIVFATVAQGQKTILARDDYYTRLSPWDRSVRLHVARKVSDSEYDEFLRSTILDWTPEQKQLVQFLFDQLRPKLAPYTSLLPPEILLIRTNGADEDQSEYTRANAIVLPEDFFTGIQPTSQIRIITHEIFHLLSRRSSNLRERLYASIGFQPCGELDLPAPYSTQKLSNPDAPINDHCIHLAGMVGSPWVLPIIFIDSSLQDVIRSADYFPQVKLKFLVVKEQGNSGYVVPDRLNPVVLEVSQLNGFFEQVGRNTDYFWGPEEILAENFALMILGGDSKSPEIIEKIKHILGSAAGK